MAPPCPGPNTSQSHTGPCKARGVPSSHVKVNLTWFLTFVYSVSELSPRISSPTTIGIHKECFFDHEREKKTKFDIFPTTKKMARKLKKNRKLKKFNSYVFFEERQTQVCFFKKKCLII